MLKSNKPGVRLAPDEGVLWLFQQLQNQILTPEAVAEVFTPELKLGHDEVLKRDKMFPY